MGTWTLWARLLPRGSKGPNYGVCGEFYVRNRNSGFGYIPSIWVLGPLGQSHPRTRLPTMGRWPMARVEPLAPGRPNLISIARAFRGPWIHSWSPLRAFKGPQGDIGPHMG